jgi:RNA polymerase sigma-70 factor, ECF subfamily
VPRRIEPRHSSPGLVLEEVYREHAAFVWRAAIALGVPESAREDVVHDVFLVVARRLPEYDGRAAMTTWLFGITRGVARNRRRAAARHERKLRAVPALQPDGVHDSKEDPAEVADRRRAVVLVETFLAQLDPGHRAVFELMEVEGMSAPEVAGALRLNVNTVYTRLRAARARFRRFVDRRTGRPGHA